MSVKGFFTRRGTQEFVIVCERAMAAAALIQRDRVAVEGRVNVLCVWFVVDCSGSMAGSR